MSTHLQAVHPVLAASDVMASVQFYCDLGFTLSFQDTPEEPKYAGLCAITLSYISNGQIQSNGRIPPIARLIVLS